MAQLPNNDRVFVFQRLREVVAGVMRNAIDTMAAGRTVALGKPLVKVHEYEQYPKDKDEALEIETVDDPVVAGDDPLTSFIEIGFPAVAEDPYSSDVHTSLTVTFPIRFILGVARWGDPAFPYPTSAQLFEAVYVTCADGFRVSRDLGYENVNHQYLQQVYADTDRDEESGDPLQHVADWQLTVAVGGART